MALFIPPLINQNLTLPNTSFVQKTDKMVDKKLTNRSNQIIIKNNVKAKFIEGLDVNSIIKEDYLVTDINVQFIPDFVTDTFCVKLIMTWRNTNSNSNKDLPIKYSIIANNSLDHKIDLTYDTNYGNVNEPFYSTDLKNPLPYSKLKNLSFIFWINGIKNHYVFVFDEERPYKNDFILYPEFKEYFLRIQTGTKINSKNRTEEILSTIRFKPYEIKQGKNNYNFLDVKMYTDDKPFNRLLFKPFKISMLPFSIDDKTYDLRADLLTEKTTYEKRQTIYLNEHTFYDLKLKETRLGANKKSRVGYVVPYNYNRDFFPSFEFQINEFKKFKLSWTQKLTKSYFDENKGKIKMNLKVTLNIPRINVDQWKKIEYDFFEDLNNQDITFRELIGTNI